MPSTRLLLAALLTSCTLASAAADRATDSADRDVVRLDEVEITDTRASPYAPAATALGPLGARDVLDTPLSVNVITAELLRNAQVTSPDDVFKLSPVAQLSSPQSRFFTGVNLRGFNVGSTRRVDGVPSTATYLPLDIEDKERVEIITGLSGFLYGPGNVGGTLNYVLKRPTATRLARLTVGNTSGANFYAHADLGGPVNASGSLGYRVNLLTQNGDTAVDYQSIERQFASGAADWQVGERLRLRVDASYSHYRMDGNEPYWTAATGLRYPDAPAAGNYYGQPFSFTESTQHHLGGGADWTFSPDLKLRTGFSHREGELDLIAVNNTLSATPGAYTALTSAWEYPDIATDGGFALVDWNFATGPLAHQLTAGFYGDRDERTNFRSSLGGWNSVVLPTMSLASPTYVNTPPAAPTGAKYVAGRTLQRNFVIGDTVTLGRGWSALLGVNRTTIVDRTYAASGAVSARYNDTQVTPTASVIFKPTERLSFYASYMESLEKGGTAPAVASGVPVVNAGQVMPPLMSEQLEVGAKTRLGQVFLTAALFQIDRGLQYTDVSNPAAPIYVQDGRQVHRGLEVTATGKLRDRLTLVGGVTWLEAEITDNASNRALEGKRPTNVARLLAKAYVEYDLGQPGGFIVTGGLAYTGPQAVDNLNTDEIPGYTVADLGARYETTVAGHPFTARLAVTNVADRNYWLNSFYVGPARALRLSVSTEF